jgi:hypothetical protein
MFREKNDENPATHLLKFHEVMHQLGISHEDVLMKMFMYSLEGHACEWYLSLPPSSISSLEEFHTTFHANCKRYFPEEFLFEQCCEEFNSHFQHTITCSFSRQDERGFVDKEVEETSIMHEFVSNSILQE